MERLKITMERTRLWDRFKPYIFSAGEVGTKKPKPDPNVYRYALEQFRCDPRDAVVIEDSVFGVAAAKAAGARVIGFTGASHAWPGLADLLTEAGAETVVNRLADIPQGRRGLRALGRRRQLSAAPPLRCEAASQPSACRRPPSRAACGRDCEASLTGGPMKRVLACLAGAALLASATAAHADKAIIVLDASGSMWGQIGGEAKIAIARETLADGAQVGARRSRARLHGLWPPRQGKLRRHRADRAAGRRNRRLRSPTAANALSPKGKTPISDAVRQAAENLRYTEEKATVILITDGLETCDADPCAVATELEKAGVDFTAHVVGFGLSSEEGQQVACLAENTGGTVHLGRERRGPRRGADRDRRRDAAARTAAATAAEEPRPEKNLQVTSRPAADAEPFTGAETIRYDVYKATSDGDHEETGDRDQLRRTRVARRVRRCPPAPMS